jgi:hypothetical protein
VNLKDTIRTVGYLIEKAKGFTVASIPEGDDFRIFLNGKYEIETPTNEICDEYKASVYYCIYKLDGTIYFGYLSSKEIGALNRINTSFKSPTYRFFLGGDSDSSYHAAIDLNKLSDNQVIIINGVMQGLNFSDGKVSEIVPWNKIKR